MTPLCTCLRQCSLLCSLERCWEPCRELILQCLYQLQP